MKFFSSLIILCSLLLGTNNLFSQNSQNFPQPSNCAASAEVLTLNQSDGTIISIIGKGNMNNNWIETTDGYTVVKNSSGIYEYANKVNGNLVASGTKANNPINRNSSELNYLAGITTSIKPNLSPLKSSILNQVNAHLQNKTYPTTGNVRVLALLIDYPDLVNVKPKADFDSLLAGLNYRNGDGSFKTFYETSSGNQLTITVDVKGWYRSTNNFLYYGADSGYDKAADLVREAVDAAELAGTDFSLYDNDSDGDVDGILAVHSGPGAEIGGQTQYIWSHRWVLNGGNLGAVTFDGVSINDYMINPEVRSATNSNISGIGVFCHEFGHNLGLPDLYDTDNTNGDSEGIGNWCLMAGGAYSGSSNRPSNFSAWCRIDMGWDTPTNLTIGNTGIYSLNPSSTSRDEIFKVNTNLSNEYFLLENRQLVGKDSDLPSHGLAIWHINTNKTNAFGNSVNADETLKGVDLEEADGLNDLDNEVNRGDAGDLYPGTSNRTTFDDASNPNAQTYLLTNTNLEIRNITEVVGGAVSFDFGATPGAPCATTTTLTTTTGSFDDGSGAGLDYPNNQNCSWLIQPTSGSTITLSFSAFDTEIGNDTVTVYDGPNNASPVLGNFSGNAIPASVTSSSNVMYVQFISNATINAPGWDASYITNAPSVQCSGTTTLTTTSGSFSDGSGTSNYTNNLNCGWLIQPAGAATITFGLNSLATEINNDRIIVYDGPNNSSPQLGSYSGTNNLNTLTSSGGSIFVEFITNASVVDAGFDAFYTSSTSSAGCSGATTFTATTGSFSDGSMAANYNNNQFCSWLIQPPSGTITLSFSAFSTEASSDRVLVFDGVDNTAPQIGNFSGNAIPANLTSSSNSLYLEFRTNGTVTDQGWDASYTTSGNGCSGTTTLTAASGNFEDGSGTSNYMDNLNCSWLIQPTGSPAVIALAMNSMNLANFGDRVRVYDGTNNTGTLIGSFFFNNTGNIVNAYSGSMFVEFITDGSNNAQGWDATYSTSNTYCLPSATYTTNFGNFGDGSPASQNYLDNTSCEWLIQPTATNVAINLNFSSFNTELNNDTVTVHDGPTTASPILATISGNNPTIPIIVSTGGDMLVTFKSNGSTVAAGWQAQYQTQPIPACNGLTTLTAVTGTFDDGTAATTNYTDNLNCSWLIQPPGAAIVTLGFNRFATEPGFDFVTVYDGASNTDPVLGTFSGSNIPSLITASGGSMLVEFTSDATVNTTGWEAFYNSSTSQCFTNLSVTTVGGTISDGSGTNNYQDNLNCSWIIQPASATGITATFNNFDLSDPGDTLYFYDGSSSSAPLLAKYTGATLPPQVTSTGGILFVEFITDGATNSAGWEFTYSSTLPFTCSGQTTLISPSGSFDDGSGTTMNYDNNLNCTWLIQPTGGATVITLTMNSMNLANFGDRVSVYDGTSNGGTLIGNFFFNNTGTPVSAFSGSMFVEFTTDGNNTAQGWDASYATSSSYCQANTTFTNNFGFFDDGSPNGTNYLDNTSCEWLIQPTIPNIAVRLTFQRFDTENINDSVTVYDGASTSDPILGTFSGNTIPPNLTSSGGSMLIAFNTNGSITNNGWAVQYGTQAIPSCAGTTNLTAASGTFSDGSTNGTNYIQNSNCSWLIQPTGALNIDLNFNYFATEANNDIVTVYDGATNTSPVLGTYSGNTLPPALSSTGGSMLVEFTSNNFLNANGFEASYTSSSVAILDAPLDTVYINAGAGSTSSFTLNSNVTWTTSDNGAWLISTPVNGSGNATINLLAIQANIGPERSAEVFIDASTSGLKDTVVVIQNTSGRFLTTAPDTLNFIGTAAPSQNVGINSNVNWTLNTTASWISFSPTTGSNIGSSSVTVQDNLTGAKRTDFIVVTGTSGVSNDTVWVVQDTSTTTPPTTTLSVNPMTITLAQLMGSSDMFTVNSNTTWQTSSGASWLTVTNPAMTSDTGVVQIAANSANLNLLPRASYVAVQDVAGTIFDTVFVFQSGLTPILVGNPDTILLGAAVNSTGTLNVLATGNWVGIEGDLWFSLSQSNGNGATMVNLTVNTTNPGTTQRFSYVALEDVANNLRDTVVIIQDTLAAGLSTTPDTIRLNASAGSTNTFNVSTSFGWRTTDGATWLSSSPNVGTGSGVVTITSNTANSSPTSERISFVEVSTSSGPLLVDTVWIIQEAVQGTLAATPDVLNLNFSSGSNGVVNITADVAWTITNPASWLTVSQLAGTNNATLTMTANSDNLTGATRSAILMVDGVNNAPSITIRVNQLDGSVPSFEVSRDTVLIANPQGSTGKFDILANTSTWTLTENTSWLLINPTSGIGFETITALVATRNILGVPRYAEITASSPGFPSKTVVIAQEGSTPLFEVLSDSLLIGADSADFREFNINSNLPSWKITENASWLEISPDSGGFTERITARAIEFNTTSSQRSETVVISSPPSVPQTIVITQDTISTIGIQENNFSESLKLYPNPTSGNITIEIGNEFSLDKNLEAKVFNLLGAELPIMIDFSNSNKVNISLENQAKGIYFLMINYQGEMITRKISLVR